MFHAGMLDHTTMQGTNYPPGSQGFYLSLKMPIQPDNSCSGQHTVLELTRKGCLVSTDIFRYSPTCNQNSCEISLTFMSKTIYHSGGLQCTTDPALVCEKCHCELNKLSAHDRDISATGIYPPFTFMHTCIPCSSHVYKC